MDELHKPTSAFYGQEHQAVMLGYYRQSKIAGSYEHRRIMLGDRLVNDYVRSELGSRPKGDITIVDIGCSVGAFAIHFAKQGYNSIGIDFDEAAITIARKLNAEELASAKFIRGDVSSLRSEVEQIDIAVCMDIFEHLHDDELGALFYSVGRALSSKGCIVFHTLPMEFDYVFWNKKKGIVQFPILLGLFKRLKPSLFSRLVRIYALIMDIGIVCIYGKTYKQYIKRFHHCNPLTQERLVDIFERAGYQLKLVDSGFLTDQFAPKDQTHFYRQPITHRSLSGIAVKK